MPPSAVALDRKKPLKYKERAEEPLATKCSLPKPQISKPMETRASRLGQIASTEIKGTL
jgi:hypothetical protein